jgi:hypothetical protein
LVVRGRWPRAIFYDSKGTLFNWAWTWQKTAEELVSRYAPEVSAKEFLQDWVTLFEGFHRRAAFRGYADFFRHESGVGQAAGGTAGHERGGFASGLPSA